MEPAKWTINLACVTQVVALSPAVLSAHPATWKWSLESEERASPQPAALVDTSHKSQQRRSNDSLESPPLPRARQPLVRK